MPRVSRKVLMIGVDAAESTLIEAGIADGTLPNLARLRQRGLYGRLASPVDWLTGSPWPTFYTGVWPNEHGFYNYLQWRPQRMRHQRPSADWLPMTPFWRRLSAADRRAIAVDVPISYPPAPFEGLEINGWAGHDKFWPPASHPRDLLKQVQRRFGREPLESEIYGLQSPRRLRQLCRQLIDATQRVADLGIDLMTREPWDLFLIVLGAAHRGGHKLWDETGAPFDITADEAASIRSSIPEIYRACDEGVGRIVDAADGQTAIVVFSLHGMGPNTSCAALLPEMLDRVLNDRSHAAENVGDPETVLDRLRTAVPVELRSVVKSRLPQAWQDHLTTFWRRSEVAHLNDRPAFCILGDLEGFVRINLQGRERDGIVPPDQYEALCERICDGLASFVELETGKPVVSRIGRGGDLFPPTNSPRDLPDLVVHWSDTAAAARRTIESPRFGSIEWPLPGRNPDGRCGHHLPDGWMIGVDEAFAAGSQIDGRHILDLAPTVYELLGLPKPAAMRGKSLIS